MVHLSDAATGLTITKLEGPRSDRSFRIGLSPEGTQLVAITSHSQIIRCWDLASINHHLKSMVLGSEPLDSTRTLAGLPK